VTGPHRRKGGGVPGVEQWGRTQKARDRMQVLEKYVKKEVRYLAGNLGYLHTLLFSYLSSRDFS